MSKIEVIGLGALNMDNIYHVESLLGDGETAVNREQAERILEDILTSVIKESVSFPGGSAANTIYGLAKLGVSTGFVGAVGNDAKGKALIQDFQKAGTDTAQIKIKPKAKTGSALCLSDKLNFRSISVFPEANSLLAMKDIDLDYLNRAEVLHISSFVDDAQLRILRELMDRLDSSVRVSFSPGSLYAAKGLGALEPILARTYTLFMNESEIRQLTGEALRAGAETCLKQGCRMVVVTLGKEASPEAGTAVGYIKTADKEYTVESSQKETTPVSDTIGAGDAFATGFLYGFLNEKSLEECGRLGDIVARFSITRIGARQGLPTLNELAQRYRQLYNQPL